jgi:type I site-specific restriction endonuclease
MVLPSRHDARSGEAPDPGAERMTETEADTCRRHVVPALQAAGWDTAPHSIAEQRTITDGRIVPVGRGFVRKPPKRVDFLLRYRRDFPLAVVEATGTADLERAAEISGE